MWKDMSWMVSMAARSRTGITARRSHPRLTFTPSTNTMIVVEGCYTLIIYAASGAIVKIPMRAGEECFIPHGVPHGGEVAAGTRTNALGGHRANRVENSPKQVE